MAKVDADSNNANGFLLELQGMLSLLTLIILTVFAGMLLILFTRPYIANSDVTHASLAEFNFSTATTTNNFTTTVLHYQLNLNIGVGNPNENYGVYYDNVQVLAYYKTQRFGMANLRSFYQGTKNTTEMILSLKGQLMIFDGTDDHCRLNHCDNIVVELYSRNKYQTPSASIITRWIWPSWEEKVKMTCNLEVTLFNDYKKDLCYEEHFDDELHFHFVFLCLLEFHLVILAVVLLLILLWTSAEAEEQSAVQVYEDNCCILIVVQL